MASSADKDPKDSSQREPPSFLDDDWSWTDVKTWPLSVVFFPVFVAIVGVALMVYNRTNNVPSLDMSSFESCASTFNYTFAIAEVRQLAERLATHDWEIGAAAEAFLELENPVKAVFSSNAFPNGVIPPQTWWDQALWYVQSKIRIDGPTLFDDPWGVSDPASLGTFAVMLGQREEFLKAATRQKDFLLHDAPRYENGAISHRVHVVELWSDAIFMFPTFLAYYAVAARDLNLMREAVRQCELYRDVLQIRTGERKGLWKHIVGPSEMADEGAWATGNAWAAYGMARVRATIAAWPSSNQAMQQEKIALDGYIAEILDAVMNTDGDESGLLRNYLGDGSWFGETSGTALLAAAAYRLGMFLDQQPDQQKRYLSWADQKRRAVVKRVDLSGVAAPAVNPLKHDQRTPLEAPSPEGESFLLLMGAAWRDCVCSRVCELQS